VSRTQALLGWLEDKSDWLSPLVVKEVRQMVRGREFHYSFGVSLVVGLAVAFYAAAIASLGDGTTGAGSFTALMVCLTLLGMLVVPVGAFSALRTERMEQTLELVTVTALSPRRVVVGKLMAQAVKLVTLFAAIAPFMAMSFLLGGIDFFTILISLAVLFLWSLWAAALFLFLSTLFKSRAMSGVVFGAAGIMMLFVLTLGRSVFFGFSFYFSSGFGGSRSDFWWGLGMLASGCVMTTVNLVLLAENRLTVPTQNRVTALRIGFFAQFLLMVAWALSCLAAGPSPRTDAAQVLAVIAGMHLAVVAMFTVTEDLAVPRRVLLELQNGSRWGWLAAPLRPGGGRGAAYVLIQMVLLVLTVLILDADLLGQTLAICAYICAFSGLPAYVVRRWRSNRISAFKLRVVLLVVVALSAILPDLLYYVFGKPEFLDLDFGRRHLINPFRALVNWSTIVTSGWVVVPLLLGFAGLTAFVGLMRLGAVPAAMTREPAGVPVLD